MDVFKNPDEVIQEVEQEEVRRERATDVKDEMHESPEADESDADED